MTRDHRPATRRRCRTPVVLGLRLRARRCCRRCSTPRPRGRTGSPPSAPTARHCLALDRAAAAGVPTFTCRLADHPDRAAWNRALSAARADATTPAPGGARRVHEAGRTGVPRRLSATGWSTRTRRCCPRFPGMHAPADALAHGVKLTGCTVFLVDGGIDAGPIVAQRAVPVCGRRRRRVAARADQGGRADAAGRGGRRADRSPYTVTGRKVKLG